jgi:hypothetical protein
MEGDRHWVPGIRTHSAMDVSGERSEFAGTPGYRGGWEPAGYPAPRPLPCSWASRMRRRTWRRGTVQDLPRESIARRAVIFSKSAMSSVFSRKQLRLKVARKWAATVDDEVGGFRRAPPMLLCRPENWWKEVTGMMRDVTLAANVWRTRSPGSGSVASGWGSGRECQAAFPLELEAADPQCVLPRKFGAQEEDLPRVVDP